MTTRPVTIAPRFESWQAAARRLLVAGMPPDAVVWRVTADPGAPETASGDPARETEPEAGGEAPPAGEIRVPRRFVDLARRAAAHPDPERWALLYAALWRLVHEGRGALDRTDVPEIARLARLAEEGERALVETPPGAAAFVPPTPGTAGANGARRAEAWDALRRAAATCAGCALHLRATQTVFGQGPLDARAVLVGEQPGDQEDLRGAPFVGPAGEVLDRALGEAGLDRRRLYVTNAVKHFKYVRRGPRRIHEKPGIAEVRACRPWLEAELALIRPELLVCLGATAASAVLGPGFRLLRDRGRFVESPLATRALATLHPSAVLRGEDPAAQARLYGLLVQDLRTVAAALEARAAS